ncbi:IS110 family RNA-guided transposase [Actinomadura physcomitrii]|uniref:IS110 family transposase n=1 Tax=Actinomadura physcomitrii TaxID=2650748 RepID=UPI002E271470
MWGDAYAVFCGIDWFEQHHDVVIVDGNGGLVARQRIGDDAAGFGRLLEMLAQAGDGPDAYVPVAVETSRGLLVACLRASGRPVFVIDPMAVARYRERHTVSRKKSDHGDAMVLANILRTDMAAHRALLADSELAQAVAVLARAQQDAVWDRTQAHNKLRSLLREYYPAFLAAFRDARGGIVRPEARAILAAAPTPAAAAAMSVQQIADLLRQAGRQRGVTARAARIHQALTSEHLRQPSPVEQAMGRRAVALLRALDTACVNAEELAAAAEEAFDQHPDSEIITSLPGLGRLTGARVLAEIGDDRSRFADARSLKAYAGAAPVTRASGKRVIVMHRRVKNQRLATAGYQWAFSALTASPGAHAHYQRRRQAGDSHTAALRNTFNRLLGCLHHCLHTQQPYQEATAFAVRTLAAA